MLLAVMVGIVPTASQLPCDSQLRRVRPQLFQHCSICSYSQWSSWKVTGKVSSTSCTSGKAFNQIRTRHDLQGSCVQQNQTNYTCKNEYMYAYILTVNFIQCNNLLYLGQPTRAEKAKLLIKSLDLGYSGITPKSPKRPAFRNFTAPANVTVSKRALPDYCPTNVQKICSTTQSKKVVHDTIKLIYLFLLCLLCLYLHCIYIYIYIYI